LREPRGHPGQSLLRSQLESPLGSRILREVSEASLAKPRDSNAEACDGSRTGRLYIAFGHSPEGDSEASAIPELPARYFLSSDRQIVAAHKAEPYDRTQLPRDRQEGHFQ
jgi:hypothetical protein